MAACLAAERYRQARGRWPDSLADLVPGQLAALPLDPYDGQPLRWRRLPYGIVIYSVGRDGEDNGGKLDRANPYTQGTDLGVELWDVPHRRQPPQPPTVPAADGR